ncbi:hypothetical protein, partial [Saccharicrinis sp. FJH54]|uniref:hypothetical protein n=1 Tax=Saccharicrinis sp. FJH54 TaxID=3344665 RepID=UPI0035D3E11B
MKINHISSITTLISMIVISMISCNQVTKTDLNAAEKVLEKIGGKADLFYTEYELNEINDFKKIVDFQIQNCNWIDSLEFDKNLVAPYAAFHLYSELSNETKDKYEAVNISFDNNLEDDVYGKYIYSMEELEFINNAFSTTKTYLNDLLINQVDFKPLNFIQSVSLNKLKIDSINTNILNEINNKILRIDLLSFGYLENNYITLLSMIEYKPNEFHVV